MAKTVIYTCDNRDYAINMNKVYTVVRDGICIRFWGAPTETEEEYPKPIIDILEFKTEEDAKQVFQRLFGPEDIYVVHKEVIEPVISYFEK